MPTETLKCWIVKKLLPKNIADKMCPKCTVADGVCWNCGAKNSFRIPRRGYSNGCGCCSGCGSVYTMLSNYGLVTLFPPGVAECYMEDVRSRAGFNTTKEE